MPATTSCLLRSPASDRNHLRRHLRRRLRARAAAWVAAGLLGPLPAAALDIVLIDPGLSWGNPLAWDVFHEPLSDYNIHIRTNLGIAYAPLLHPGAVFETIMVGHQYAPPPANNFRVTPSAIGDAGFFVDMGAGAFSPVLEMPAVAGRTLRAATLKLADLARSNGALMMHGGRVELSGSLLAGGSYPSAAYVRLRDGGAGAPVLSVGQDLVLAGAGAAEAFLQQDAGQIAIGGSLRMGRDIGREASRSFANLAGGTLSTVLDTVVGGGAGIGGDAIVRNEAGLRIGNARLEVGRDLMVGADGGIGHVQTLAGAAVSVGRNLVIGGRGAGSFSHGAGTLTVAQHLWVGPGGGGHALLELLGDASLAVGGELLVSGRAEANEPASPSLLRVDTGGTLHVTGPVTVGRGQANFGQLNLQRSGGTVFKDSVTVGNGVHANSRIDQAAAAGIVDYQSHVLLGREGKGSWSLAPGAHARVAGTLIVGEAGSGVLDGGRLELGADLVLGALSEGHGDASADGAAAHWTVGRDLVLGEQGSGTMTMTGSARVDVARDLVLGRAVTGGGQLSFEQGLLAVGQRAVIGDAGSGTVTLLPTATRTPRLTVAGDLVLGDRYRIEHDGNLTRYLENGNGTLLIGREAPKDPSTALLLDVGGRLVVGNAGRGALLGYDGRAQVAGDLLVAQGPDAVGTLALQGEAHLGVGGAMQVGGGGVARATLNAPELAVAGALAIGMPATGSASFELLSGRLLAASISVGPTGRFTATGGGFSTGALTLGSGSVTSLQGVLGVGGAGVADHQTTTLQLQGTAALTLPTLRAGPGGTIDLHGTSQLSADRVELAGGTLLQTGGVLQTGVLQVEGAGIVGGQFTSTGGRLLAGTLAVGAGGRLNLAGSLHLGLPGPDHQADTLQLPDAVGGDFAMTVPTLVIGGQGSFQGGVDAALATQRIDLLGGTVTGTLRNTQLLNYHAGDASGATLLNEGQVVLHADLTLGELRNGGGFDLGAGRRVQIGAAPPGPLAGAGAGSGRLSSIGTVSVGAGSQLSASTVDLFYAGRLEVSGGSVHTSGGLTAGSLGVGVSRLVLDNATLLVGGKLTLGADGAASLTATQSSIAVGGGGEQKLHIGSQGQMSVTGGSLQPAAADSLLRVAVDSGGGLFLGGTVLDRVEAVDVAGHLYWDGAHGGLSTQGPQPTRVTIAAGGQFTVDMGVPLVGNAGKSFMPELVNHGSWRKLSGNGQASGKAIFHGPVTQAGTLDLEDGWLELVGGAIGSGTTRIAAAGRLQMVGWDAPAGAPHYDWSGSFSNHGRVVITNAPAGAGALARFTSSGTHAGTFMAGHDATLSFGGGVQNFVAAAAGAGQPDVGVWASGGHVEFSGGDLTFGAGTRLSADRQTARPSTFGFTGGILRLEAGSRIDLPLRFTIEGSDLMLSTGSVISHGSGITLGAGALGGSDRLLLSGGPFDWSGGTLYGPGELELAAASSLRIHGAADKRLDRLLISRGPAAWDGGNVDGGGTLRLMDSFTGRAAAHFTPNLRIHGSYLSNVAGGGMANLLGRVDVQGGSIVVQTGALRLAGGGSSDGPLRSNSILEFAAGEFVLDGTGGTDAGIYGQAKVVFSGGHTLLRNGASYGTALEPRQGDGFLGGVLEFAGGSRYWFTPTLTITAGGLIVGTGNGPFTLPATTTLHGGLLAGSDARVVPAGGLLDWRGGTLAGPGSTTVAAGATLRMQGDTARSLESDLFNAGLASWEGGAVDGPARFNNLAGAQFDISASAAFGPALDNAGLLRVANGAGTAVLTRTLRNDGQLRVESGTLQVEGNLLNLNAGQLSGGQWAIAGTLRHAGPAVSSVATDITFSGAGASFRTLAGNVELLDSVTAIADGARLRIESGRGLTLANRAIALDGRLEVGGGSVFAAASGSLTGAGLLQVQDGGRMDWTRSNLSATGTLQVDAGGLLLMADAGSNHDHAGRVLVNQGTVHWTGGDIRGGASGGVASRIDNAGLWLDGHGAVTSRIADDNAPAGTSRLFSNTGTYRKTGTGTTNFTAQRFDNAGRVELAEGALQFNAGGVNRGGGVIDIAAGRTLTLNGGADFHFEQGSAVTGAGTLLLQGGGATPVATISGAVSFANLVLANGTIAGTHALDGQIRWGLGALGAGGTTTIAPTATLLIENAGSNHEHAGRGIVNQGTVRWTGGDIRGGASGGAASSIANAGLWLDEHGAVTSRITDDNAPAGTTRLFSNTGTYRKTGTGKTNFTAQRFDNAGRVELAEGVLAFNAGGVNRGGGVIDIAAGRTLTLNGGADFRFEDGSAVTGAGALLLQGGGATPVATISGAVSFANLVLANGTIAGTHALDGQIRWGLGALGAGGTTTIAPTATLLIENAGSNHDHAGRSIVNQGTVHWTGGDIRGGGSGAGASRIDNAGLWLDDHGAVNHRFDHGNSIPATSGVIANSGTYRKTGNGTTTVWAHRFDNSGRVEVLAGRLDLLTAPEQVLGNRLAGGQWDVGSGATLAFAGVAGLAVNEAVVSLRGAGSVFAPINALADNRGEFRISEGRHFTTAGNLVNSGLLFAGAGSRLTVNGTLTSTGTLAGAGELQVGLLNAAGPIAPGASPGVLTISGDLVMASGAALAIEIAGLEPGSGHDRLLVTGAATLAGPLQVNLLASFAGLDGGSFTIVSAGSLSGQFDGLADGARLGVGGLGGSFAIDYTGTGVQLSNYVAAVPEPASYALLLAGLGLLGALARQRPAGAVAAAGATEARG